eukprot:CAMPEP_0172710758 /NCGR_PEP_ID=MMETSP1074-20121228/56672_1 /TAXON_ID=2916 /ORGANISM="Ceratium fusus, Strain PA161109" /LENGTH=187 /DNA_ID=CAMNT_0013534243 /DNA_START=49 /DNA_END=612 /DNA_ORIENTATION=-
MVKKRNARKENHMAHLLRVEEEAEKKRTNRAKARKEFREKKKDILVRKLVQVAKDEGIPVPQGVDAASMIAATEERNEVGNGDTDVKMTPSGSKVKGVIRKIGKIKSGHKTRAPQISKALFLAAKRRGAIQNIQVAKETLYGRKKIAKPNGKERARDRRLRKAREKRERKMKLKPVSEGSESEGNSE